MDRSKLVAIITGVISLLLAVGYLVLVQLLDFRGDMVPAPLSALPQGWPHIFSFSSLTHPSFF
ncbi:MAG: glucose-inhibited division protein A [Leptolyngbya sp.]|nr:MAG: glucose-inhibited division protein A [Leptolyngbya sp.]